MNNDLISRQAATTISILPKEHRKYQTMNIDDAYDLGWLDCQNCIEKLPSAQPETGKWIKLYAGNYKCSVCGVWFANDDNEMVEDFKYCPNCGCKMEVEG